ncbi:MAG TPA: hypothetical protein VLZ51_06415, partial [Brevundimonas sp.]|nr:hypothetical protein [Brevundimonas sp.]
MAENRLSLTPSEHDSRVTLRRPIWCVALLGWGLMTVAAGPAVAQSSIGLGGRASGALEAGDLVTADGRFYDCYRLRANRNAWVSISLNSRRFDGFIELGEGGS